jgi:hypothetical protein
MQLTRDRLCVEIAEPGTLYRGTRFDWSAFITQVTLDGRHTFCVPEAVDGTGTGGSGLCAEFGIFHPVGYDGCPVGGEFPKLGVGLLTRPDAGPYRFSRACPLQPFPITVEAAADQATFSVAPLPVRGYAARLVKRVSVREATLCIDCRLENVGTQPLRTREYVHNFLAPNGAVVGPETQVCLSFRPVLPPGAAAPCPPLRLQGTEVTWEREPAKAFYQPLAGFAESAAPAWWELRMGGAVVRETTDVPWAGFTLWGTRRVVSGEVFVGIDLAPGAVKAWRRTYTFGTADA